METVTRNSSRKTKKAKPVVDVPKSAGDEGRIGAFIDKNRTAVTKFMESQFDGVGKKEVDEVLRECAECSVLTRSPKQGGCWEEDTQIIEDALKICQPVKLAAVPDDDLEEEEPEEEVDEVDDVEDEDDEEPEDEESEDEEIEDLDLEEDEIEEPVVGDEEEVEEDVSDEDEEQSNPVVASQEAPLKKPTKEAKSKSGTKTTKAKATKKTQSKEDKTVKASKKAQPSKAQTKAMKSHEILTTTRFSADSLKDLKGLDLWLGTARLLKIEGKIFCQVQDMPEVIGHLYDVHNGKAKLEESGFTGKGEKSYKKRRLTNILGAIKAHLGIT